MEEAVESKRDKIQDELRKNEDNLLYVKFFPSNEKYISLYAEGSEKYEDKRQAILKVIKEKTNQKQAKLKAELQEPNPEESEGIEGDEFFETESTKPKKVEKEKVEKRRK